MLAPDPQQLSVTPVAATQLARLIEVTVRATTSWVGLLTAYAGAGTAAVLAFRNLAEPLAGWSVWARVALVSALPVLVFVFHTIPTLVEHRRRRRLSEITGTLQPGYFRLAPREDEESFTRADGKHDEVLKWLLERDQAKVLYLTGASGSGKSSLLAAWVLPQLERQGTNRAIVRPLDAEQQTWEISHDFLVPLLDSITANWRTSFWRRSRPWLPWIGAALAVAVIGISTLRRDPIRELTDMGWTVEKTDKGLNLSTKGPPPKGSLTVLMRTRASLTMTLGGIDDSVSQWGDLNLTELEVNDYDMSNVEPLKALKNLTKLDLSLCEVSNVEPLKELKNLTTLDLSYNKVSNVEPLKELKNLTTLDLGKTEVSNVEPLKELKNLITLDLSETKVSHVEPLKELKSLTSLDLYDTKVSAAAIEGLKNANKNLRIGVGERQRILDFLKLPLLSAFNFCLSGATAANLEDRPNVD